MANLLTYLCIAAYRFVYAYTDTDFSSCVREWLATQTMYMHLSYILRGKYKYTILRVSRSRIQKDDAMMCNVPTVSNCT